MLKYSLDYTTNMLYNIKNKREGNFLRRGKYGRFFHRYNARAYGSIRN